MDTALIGIDWGTTQLRGFRLDDAGQVLERRETGSGISTIQNGAFYAALQSLIGDWQNLDRSIPILMCGMIGSRQGWREVPYVPCPAQLSDFVRGGTQIETGCGRAYLIGGLTCTDDAGLHDVMRGEEMQILGVAPAQDRHLAIAPGTHSKWAVIDNGRIESFRTYMTGEAFALLRKHSSLGWMMRDAADDAFDGTEFRNGVERGLDDTELLRILFSVRTRGLFENLDAGASASYLSGLLIGSEIAAGLRHGNTGSVTVIAAPTLGKLYGIALGIAGVANIVHSGTDEAVTQGLWQLWQMNGKAA